MESIKAKFSEMMYPVYGFRLEDDKVDTKCKDLRRRDITVAFFGQMSAHGPPHIYGARGLIKKVIWTLVTVTALVWMFIQLRSIFTEFLAYKVTVSVDIRTARAVDFPSITVCNLNAIRKSYLPSEFQEKFTAIESYDQQRVAQREEEERQQLVLQQQQQQQEGNNGREPQENEDKNDPEENKRNEDDEEDDGNPNGPDENRNNYQYGEPDFVDPDDAPAAVDPMADPNAPADDNNNNDPQNSQDQTNQQNQNPPNNRRKKRQVETPEGEKNDDPNNPETPTNSEQQNTEEDPRENMNQFENQNTADQQQQQPAEKEQQQNKQLQYYDPVGESNQEEGTLGADRDAADIKAISIFEGLTAYDTKTKSSWGHQLSDFIVECTYNGYACSLGTMFESYYNWRYGNCYAFNAATNNSLPSYNTGPLYGLKITFNIEQDEYVSDLSDKAGVRVLIHSKGEMPFPEDKGLDIAPGRVTSVGIRTVIVSRKGGKYGDCVNVKENGRNISRNVFEEAYPWTNYTLQACMLSCFQKYVIQTCGCFDSNYPSMGEAVGNSDTALPVCSSFDSTQTTCKFKAESSYRAGNLSCSHCHLACNETSYQATVSQAAWPALAHKDALIATLSGQSDSLKALLDQGGSVLEDNFAKLIIYYEELNLEEIIETPSYTLASFISDMGGTLGLWIGLSVLSLFEMIEFLMDHVVITSMKLCNWSSDKPDNKDLYDNSSVRPTSEASLVKPHFDFTRDKTSSTIGIGAKSDQYDL